MHRVRFFLVAALVLSFAPAATTQQRLGYYRFPSLWKDTIVFTAEAISGASRSAAASRSA